MNEHPASAERVLQDAAIRDRPNTLTGRSIQERAIIEKLRREKRLPMWPQHAEPRVSA